MATQAEAISYLKSNFKCEAITDDLFKVLVEFEEDRSQLVFVGIYTDVISLNSPFASCTGTNARNVSCLMGWKKTIGSRFPSNSRYSAPVQD